MASDRQILVTGGLGFVGSHLVDALIQRGHRVRVFDNLDPQVHSIGDLPAHTHPDAEVQRGDVRDPDALKRALDGVEVVFHEAAVVGVGQSQYEVRRYVDANVMGTANLLDLLVNAPNRVEKLIVAASMSSYGEGMYDCASCGPARPDLRPEAQLAAGDWEVRCPTCGAPMSPRPIEETAERRPNSIYAITKMNQEDMALNIGRTYGIPAVALRYFNIYGPRQSLSNPYTGVAAIFMSRIKNDRSPVVYEDGQQARDFVSVHDVVQANLLAMERREADGQAFNVGTGVPLTIQQVAVTLAGLYDKPIQPEITRRFRKGDIRHCIADISKAGRLLGYAPRVTFQDGMAELIEWSKGAEAVDRFEQAASELARRRLA
ncbi:MAG: nucleoside-diphosphate-sugar epimerase [Candidatus Handelsmanbacteria bacterium RIFCSPLOWO2_12_FULL_64_10]|uniref:Nucleoside-diphosphate-sugar epimerase n=1 Tax=Handelsmanbacteria sp. (strain RIFCSPLOWO2_12_FULL_64_10) TaxID=1817868 RepID=A0A1F6CBY9_HANXR|nr:MAG: nucleoside-diphosphate-sugar epimerase [Candidatus Handelsmanbacteria bacterium RIFCSPLOWO2_12_FULL_64_10]